MSMSRNVMFLINSLLCLAFFEVAVCLFEDQAGKFDWRQQYIGKVKFTYADLAVSGSQFVVATEENVLACLSTRTGSIIWRQVLEMGKEGVIDALSESGDLITVSGGGRFIRSWDVNTGVLLWETQFPLEPKKNAAYYFAISSSSKDIIKIEVSAKLANVYVYSFTRASLKKSDSLSVPWYNENSKCNFISSSYFVCIESNKKTLHLLSVKDSGAFIPVTMKSLGVEIGENLNKANAVSLPYQESSEEPFFALQLDYSGILLQIHSRGLKFIKIIPSFNKITASHDNDTLVVFFITELNRVYEMQFFNPNQKADTITQSGTFTLTEDRGAIESFFVLRYVKKDLGINFKMLITSEDHSILLVHQFGKHLWSREEALSNIMSTEIMDLPLSDTDATIEQDFGQVDSGMISMLLARLKSQVYHFQGFLIHTLLGLKGERDRTGDNAKSLTRDTFGLHKIIVVITKPGKFFGIDNLSGLILWSHFEKNFLPIHQVDKEKFILFVQRTTAHFPYPPVCTAIGKDLSLKQGRLYSFDPITGSTIESKTLAYNVLQVMLSGTTSYYLREILLLDSEHNVHIYPESHSIQNHKNSHFIFTADPVTGLLVGYSMKDGEHNLLQAVEVWNLKLPQPITDVIIKRPLEHVHSQGRVMGDRSVLYKYINPNLAAIFTEGTDVIYKTFCNIYLIDVVTGLVIYSASHKRCIGPVNVVHAENWVIYSFYNDKSRRMEISSIELFEGKAQSNTTAFSSMTPPPLPLVEHQTFIFPSSIVTMTDTVTERGMTNKHLLIALPSGGILELPKTFLDPRRPIHPLPEHREEGLIPYIPELPVMSEGIINYNQSVVRVKNIVTAPSGLESTCLVFVHGLDLFYTRVTPSKTFDILKDDFDHYLIMVVLLGLLAFSYTTKKLAARKTLRAAWK